ncbi:MAG: RluA family pseudouridine synthase [Deltaproteobacteria bacterium]|nr:RluA family pseudouridine synthase [Deltaproteobacteria bacterium]
MPDPLDPVEPGWLIVVDPEGQGERLDHLVARRVPRLSRARAARLEVVDLDHPARALKKSLRVRAGQRLWVRRPPPDEDAEGLAPPEVLEEGGGLIVLNKPAGWAAHPTASRFEGALTTWLRRRGTPAHPAHRLDVETSGVLLCASDLALDLEAKAAFKAHAVEKAYLAVCEGVPRDAAGAWRAPGDRWESRAPLGFDAKSAVRLKVGRVEVAAGGWEAHTRFELLEVRAAAGAAGRCLVRAEPRTGRQHQIRAHLALEGCPLVGDKLYGPDERYFLDHLNGALAPEALAALGHPRQALHAAELALTLGGRRRAWGAPLPADLAALLVAP